MYIGDDDIVDQKVLDIIDSTIKDIWIKDIKKDYKKLYLFKEDSLKCALYYHMRRKLDTILKQNNLRIYPEFYIKDLMYRADIAIAEIDVDSEKNYLKDHISDVITIMELKFEGGYSKGTNEVIKNDISKLKRYVQDYNSDCICYFAIIYESECENLNWMDKRATNNWAKGMVTELNAGYMDGEIVFEVNSY